VSYVLAAYDELRAAGFGHHKNVRLLARRLGVDEPGMRRILRRAEEEGGRRVNGVLVDAPAGRVRAGDDSSTSSGRRNAMEDDSKGRVRVRTYDHGRWGDVGPTLNPGKVTSLELTPGRTIEVFKPVTDEQTEDAVRFVDAASGDESGGRS
jgi:hypothetical protein